MDPQIQYTKTADGVNIAYAVAGEGPSVICLRPPPVSHAQRDWTLFSSLYARAAESARVVLYDPRGAGLSDRDAVDFSLKTMLDDLETIADRAAPEASAVLAAQDSVPLAISYAAKFPHRVSHLILVDGWSRYSDVSASPATLASDALLDQDWTVYSETLARVLSGIDDPDLASVLGAHIRACMEPEAFRAFVEAERDYDVLSLLASVKAPTLVLQNNESPWAPIREGQKLAAGIPDARFLAIDDMNYERVVPLVEEFMGRAATSAPPPALGGNTHTILFTDMASSTTLADRLGDAAAQEVRRTHNDIVRASLLANDGNEIKHTGDGIMASFGAASSALDAAIAIQRGVAQHKEKQPDSPLAVYVGLNAGEPIAEDDDLFGTSINLAARICNHAEAGQILAANVVRELAAGKDFLFSDLGETELRGFEDPVKLWELSWQDG